MTSSLSPDDIERCRHVPIHKLIGDPRLGRKIKIVCPFHAERTGSCTLFPAGGFYCFGCGAKGNSVDFVMKIGATFEEALTELKPHI